MSCSQPSSFTAQKNRIAVFISFSGTGGVERMVSNLLHALVASGVCVDLLPVRTCPASIVKLAQQNTHLRIIDLGVSHTHLALPGLIRYLRQSRPYALLAAKDRAIRTAVVARLLSGVECRLVGRLGTNLAASQKVRASWKRWLRTCPMRFFYQHVDGVVAVSEGVAEDTRLLTGLPEDRISVIRNPVITPEFLSLAAAPVSHRWLLDKTVPVVLGVGRLTAQKDFPTLIRAFALARHHRPMRLIILGEGDRRDALVALAQSLNVADVVDFPGYDANPYPWMHAAQVFVLSSLWEGSPNALTEALALGTAVVATDCPSGPRELLEDGRYGALVPMGDEVAMAAAIVSQLEKTPDPEVVQAAVADYHADVSAAAYLRILEKN